MKKINHQIINNHQAIMKKNNFLSAILFASLLMTACGNEQAGSTVELASPVSVDEVTENFIKKYNSTSGTAMANAEVELTSEMAGEYHLMINPRTNMPYRLGDKVMAGETIVKLTNKSYENDIAIDSKKLSLEIAEQDEVKKRALYEKGGVTQSEVRNAEVTITNAKYSYENAQINLNKMNIKAPFTGIIVNLPHYTRDVQLASGSSIVSIMSYDKMIMEINLPESAIGEVKTGQEVAITHYTLPQDTIQGTISELSPAISPETRTFKGKLLIDNKDLKLRPGMFVKADIVVDEAENTIVIPKEIVMNNRGRKYVFIVERGVARMRNIRTGLEDQNNIEVLEGLNLQDQLVTRGYETLRDGSKVKIQK